MSTVSCGEATNIKGNGAAISQHLQHRLAGRFEPTASTVPHPFTKVSWDRPIDRIANGPITAKTHTLKLVLKT